MAKRRTYYVILDGDPRGPYTKMALTEAFFLGQIPEDSLYSYEGARKWHPVAKFFDHPSPKDMVYWRKYYEKRQRKYYVAMGNEVVGPYSFVDLEKMMAEARITHHHLYSTGDGDEWKPLAKLPVPALESSGVDPKLLEEDSYETMREEYREEVVPGFDAVIEISCTKEVGYNLFIRHRKSGFMYVERTAMREIWEMLASGEINLETSCAREDSLEWRTVGDYVRA